MLQAFWEELVTRPRVAIAHPKLELEIEVFIF
jgi:hypothetical protein